MLGVRFIVRMDYKKVKGWFVRVPSEPEGHHTKLFSDGVYGSRMAALYAAIEWRNKELHRRRPTSPSTPRKTFRRNSSGVVGVTKIIRNGIWYGWKAYWNESLREQKFEKFLFSQYSRRAAYRLAVECRRENEQRIRERIRAEVRREGYRVSA